MFFGLVCPACTLFIDIFVAHFFLLRRKSCVMDIFVLFWYHATPVNNKQKAHKGENKLHVVLGYYCLMSSGWMQNMKEKNGNAIFDRAMNEVESNNC